MGWTGKTWGWILLAAAPTVGMLAAVTVLFGNDDGVAEAMHRLRETTPSRLLFFETCTDYAALPFYCTYALLIAAAVRKRDGETARFAGYAIVSLAATLLAVYCLKVSTSRPRPFIHGDHEGLFSFDKQFHSFPSNHSSEIFAISLPFVLRHRAVWFAAGIGVFNAAAGFARLYLGSHFPTDILGSVVVGCCISFACADLARSLFARRDADAVAEPAAAFAAAFSPAATAFSAAAAAFSAGGAAEPADAPERRDSDE